MPNGTGINVSNASTGNVIGTDGNGVNDATEGNVIFLGLDLTCMVEERQRDTIRELQMVFQALGETPLGDRDHSR